MLTREGVHRGNTVIITSILPTDIGGRRVAERIQYINDTLAREVVKEGGHFIDLTKYFVRHGILTGSLYRQERTGLLHLNADGARVMTHKLNEELIKMGMQEMVEDFRVSRQRFRK